MSTSNVSSAAVSNVENPELALPENAGKERISWVSSMPFIAVHVACLLAFVTGVHVRDIVLCLGLYFLRMFGITGGYHRYFSHRSYKTGRPFQFVLALLGTISVQKGVLWWAGHHRHHHRESDQPADIHSPMLKGFLWSHVGWILCPKYNATPFDKIKDFASFPELRWLNKHFLIPPVTLAVGLFFMGHFVWNAGLETLTWGFFISTVLLWHGTFTINSLSHIFGARRYKTTDTSRNNWLLALITMGEGWHNNHHYHQNTANQGWFWWEVDFSYYILRTLSAVGIVWDLRTPSEKVKLVFRGYNEADRATLKSRTPFGTAVPTRVAAIPTSLSERAAPSEPLEGAA